MMTFPATLSLRTTEEGPRLFAYPVDQIKKIHGKGYESLKVYAKSGSANIEKMTVNEAESTWP